MSLSSEWDAGGGGGRARARLLPRCQRLAAAFLAISFRFLADMPAARAFPPMRPSATAAAFLPSAVVISSISPAAILAIMTAWALTPAGRFCPLGPVDTAGRLLL